MAKFYVGQRVRIKWCDHHPEIAGKEGMIIGKFHIKGHDWEVAPDCWGSSRSPSGVGIFAPVSDQLEPITDSYDLVTWESMRDLWVPDHMREQA